VLSLPFHSLFFCLCEFLVLTTSQQMKNQVPFGQLVAISIFLSMVADILASLNISLTA